MYSIQPMTMAAANEIASWRYSPPYDIYNLGQDEAVVASFLDPENRYHIVLDGKKRAVGFCCFGVDATVPGGEYSDEDALDIGLGMRPALTGQGRGHGFIGAVIDFAVGQYAPRQLRVTVASFNQRSQRAFKRAGFRPVSTFTSRTASPREFVILVKEIQ